MKIKAVGAYSAKQPLEPMDITRGKYGAYALVAIRMADALINAITREPVVSFISS